MEDPVAGPVAFAMGGGRGESELSCKPCVDTSASVLLDLEGGILLGTLVGLCLSFGIGLGLHVAP